MLCIAPFESLFPNPETKVVLFEGISKTTQCHHPEPVGASGS